jgi:release factor glutamine methyltransferase
MRARQLERSRVRSILEWGEHVLRSGTNPERARLDAEALLLHLFKEIEPDRNRAWLIAHQNDPTSSDTRLHFDVIVRRRLSGEPIQYITGQTEFYGLAFRVTPAVLIPRPETEHLVEEMLKRAAHFEEQRVTPLRILDIGTGSGCVAVALAKLLSHAAITAIDLSADALALARANAALNEVADRIRFLQGDLLDPIVNEKFELIVSNPPYVPTADRGSLSVEVREFEPALALFAGEDGLDVYRRIAPAAHAALVPGGYLLLEIGYGQSADVTALLEAAGFESIEVFPDLQGIPRVVCAQRG